MSYELGLKGKLDTAKQDLTLPKTILENISNELKAETDGEIEGMVLPYKGPIQSYTKKWVGYVWHPDRTGSRYSR